MKNLFRLAVIVLVCAASAVSVRAEDLKLEAVSDGMQQLAARVQERQDGLRRVADLCNAYGSTHCDRQAREAQLAALAKDVVAKKIDPKAVDASGRDALRLIVDGMGPAMNKRHMCHSIALALLEQGADPNLVHAGKSTVQTAAAYFETAANGVENSLYDAMVRSGADVDAPGQDGLSARRIHDETLAKLGRPRDQWPVRPFGSGFGRGPI